MDKDKDKDKELARNDQQAALNEGKKRKCTDGASNRLASMSDGYRDYSAKAAQHAKAARVSQSINHF